MKDTSPGILILGGGVAGMSAALALADQDLAVHLVERQDRLGGNAASWACMATDTCQNCGACLSQEMAEQVRSTDNISLHLNDEITALNRNGQGMEAVLASGKSLAAAKVVNATGFTPFDPAAIPSYHTRELDRVITTDKLNTLIREDRLADLAGPAPKIAFLQCVGSRDREQGRDYCSQVCCKISMRHAGKVLHLLPDADISLFYMDLQIIGKEARTMAQALSGSIRLVQGVPAEVLEHPDTKRLTMVTEDPESLSRQALDFDLVVLSVGLAHNSDTEALSGILDAVPNTWGFFNTETADPGRDIYAAGCAHGPKDILSAIQDGRIAADRILENLGLPAPADADIAVIGDGPQAAAVARAVVDRGYSASVFGSVQDLPDRADDLSCARILSVGGTLGRFSILYRDGGTQQTLRCGAIVAAPSPDIRTGRGRFKGALSLNDFTALDTPPDDALILLDYFGPESKAGARQALWAAMDAAGAGCRVDVLMNKMLVHGPLGQQLYDKARRSGIRFLRYDRPEDLGIDTRDRGFEVRLKETTLPGLDLLLTPTTLVIPDTPAPAAGFTDLAGLLNLGLDREGYLQPANARHRLVGSQRRGIYFAGPGHDDIDDMDLDLEIQAILAGIGHRPKQADARVAVNEKKCAKCLTCYRVCPHNAIVLNQKMRPEIMADACFECQACVSSCPAYAIESDGLANDDLADRAQKGRTLVYACERSAALAADTLPGDADLVAIPCACRISPDMLLKALIRGAERVIVSGCHEGNCRSGEGTAIARRGVAAVSAVPGVTPDKVAWQSVAANEPVIFAKSVSKAT